MDKNQKKVRLCFSFGSSRSVNLSGILPCDVQTLYLQFVIQLQSLGQGLLLILLVHVSLINVGSGFYQNLNFSFLGKIFQYYLLGLKACRLRFASFGIRAQVLKSVIYPFIFCFLLSSFLVPFVFFPII